MSNTGEGDNQQLYQRAHELREGGDLKGAIDILFDLLAEDMTDGAVVTDLASMLAEDDELDRAERVFEHALKVADDVPFLAVNYGTFLAQCGRHREAREVLNEQCSALVARAEQAEADGAEEAEREAWEGYEIASLNLARLLAETDEPGGALILAKPLLNHPDYWPSADEIMCTANKALGGDELSLAEELFGKEAASPMMVWRIMEHRAADTGDPVMTVDALAEAAGFLPAAMLMACLVVREDLMDLLDWLGSELYRLDGKGDEQAVMGVEVLESVLQEAGLREEGPETRTTSRTEQLSFDFPAVQSPRPD